MFKISAFLFLLFITFTSALNNNQIVYGNTIGNYSAVTSAITYCPEKEVELWTCHWCKEMPRMNMLNTFWDYKTSTFCYFAYDTHYKQHVLSFEGSQDIRDWLIDLEFIKLVPYKEHPTAKVHFGFWKAYNSIRENVLSTIKYNNVSKLFVTGHSLGGALATVASLDIAESLPYINIFMINLGAPRVGNKYYVDLFSIYINNYFRITHAKDPVVHLPPMAFSYYHIPNEVFYPNNTLTYKECFNSEDSSCSDGESFDLFATKDHAYYLNIHLPICY